MEKNGKIWLAVFSGSRAANLCHEFQTIQLTLFQYKIAG